MPRWHFLKRKSFAVPAYQGETPGFANTELTLWLIALQAATARLKNKGQWPTFQGQVIIAPESRSSVGIERPRDLVVGLERSYKSQEEIWRNHRRHMEEKQNSSWPSLPSNQLVEGTPPRCALLRRPHQRVRPQYKESLAPPC